NILESRSQGWRGPEEIAPRRLERDVEARDLIEAVEDDQRCRIVEERDATRLEPALLGPARDQLKQFCFANQLELLHVGTSAASRDNTGERSLKPTEPALADDALLETLQWETFEYFLREVNPQNGLVKDKTREGWPASIAATGLALAAYPVGVERGFMTRADAVAITLTTLTFLWDSEQSTAA